MPKLQSTALTNQNISTALAIGTWTADIERSSMMCNVFVSGITGGGDYQIYITHQLAGAGSAYPIITSWENVPVGMAIHKFSTILFPMNATDVAIIYLTGLAGDTSGVGITTEFWDLGYLRSTTAGRTLVVDANGLADANMVKAGPTGSGTAQTARDLGLALPAIAPAAAGGLPTVAAGALKLAQTADLTAGQSIAVSDKTGFSLSVAGILAIWNQLTSDVGIVTSTFGKKLANWVYGTDYKALMSTDAQDVSGTLSVNAKTLNGATPNNLAAGAAMTLTSAYDAAKAAASQTSVNSIPTNPLLANSALLPATVIAAKSDLPSVSGLATAAAVAAIPTTPLLAANYTAPDNADIVAIKAVIPATVIAAKADLAGIGSGSGSAQFVYTLTESTGGSPIRQAKIWITTDLAGTNTIASGETDNFGNVTFYLDPGSYYFWRQRAGYDFTNPDTEIVA